MHTSTSNLSGITTRLVSSRKQFNALYWGVGTVGISLGALALLIVIYSSRGTPQDLAASCVATIAIALLISIWRIRKRLADKVNQLRYDFIQAYSDAKDQNPSIPTALMLATNLPLREFLHIVLFSVVGCELLGAVLVIAVNDPAGYAYAKLLAVLISLAAIWAQLIVLVENGRNTVINSATEVAEAFRQYQAADIPYDTPGLAPVSTMPKNGIITACLLVIVTIGAARAGSSAPWLILAGLAISGVIVGFLLFRFRKPHIYAYKTAQPGQQKDVGMTPPIPAVTVIYTADSLTFTDPYGRCLPITVARKDIKRLFKVVLPQQRSDGAGKIPLNNHAMGINRGTDDPIIVVGASLCKEIYKWFTVRGK